MSTANSRWIAKLTLKSNWDAWRERFIAHHSKDRFVNSALKIPLIENTIVKLEDLVHISFSLNASDDDILKAAKKAKDEFKALVNKNQKSKFARKDKVSTTKEFYSTN